MPPKKKVTVVLDGEQVKFKSGALRKMLKVDEDYKFTKAVLNKLRKFQTGESFEFQNKKFKMSPLMKKRINFALVLMGSQK